MLTKTQYWILTACGILALGLLAANAWLFAGNRTMLGELEQRQLYVQQAAQLNVLYQDIAKTLAELALRSNDRQVIEMLAGQGIRVDAGQPAQPATPQEKR